MRLVALSLTAALCCACTGNLGDDSASGTNPLEPEYLPADGVTIQQIVINQGVERVLVKNGAPATGVSVIAGRDAVVRVFYATDAGYDSGTVLARLTVGAQTIDVVGPLGKTSSEDAFGSTINFTVPGASLTPAAAFRVDILRAAAQSSGKNTAAAYPALGQQTFSALSTGAKLRVVLVPVRYLADGSKRLPDTSDAQLKLYRDAIWRLYPVADVDVRVGPPLDFASVVKGDGTGWPELLDAVVKFRAAQKAAFNEHYYGIFRATDTFAQFCVGQCLAGLSQIALDASQAWARAGVGLGFTGADSGDTAAHEIGHEQGRYHAPCGTGQGLDPLYPYPKGVTQVWGFDLVAQQLVGPTSDDFMSYCKPRWISDYNYGAIVTRLQLVNAGMALASGPGVPPPGPGRYRRIALDPGGAHWLEPLDLDGPPLGEPKPLHFDTASGPLDVVGWFFPYSHLPGGTILTGAAPTRGLR